MGTQETGVFQTQPYELRLIAMCSASLGTSAWHSGHLPFLKWLPSSVWGGGKYNAQMLWQFVSSSEQAFH